jgi:hypothetical protein
MFSLLNLAKSFVLYKPLIRFLQTRKDLNFSKNEHLFLLKNSLFSSAFVIHIIKYFLTYAIANLFNNR